jgi:uncharacterized protein (UPF0179 family)
MKNNACNKIYSEGIVKNALEEGEQFSICTTFMCRHCKFSPICIARCLVRMYHVLHHSKTMTQACIHLGTHEHPCKGVKMWSLKITIFKKAMSKEQVQLLLILNKNYYHLLILL